MPAANASVGPVPQMPYGMYANCQPQVSLICTVLLHFVAYFVRHVGIAYVGFIWHH